MKQKNTNLLLCFGITVFLFLFNVQLSIAQTNIVCATDQLLQQKLLEKDYAIKHNLMEQNLFDKATVRAMTGVAEQSGTVLTIPVVVHVIHNNGPENISDAQIIQGIQNMNDAFANAAYYNNPAGSNSDIVFCLAQQDPNGNITSGIERIVSTLTDFTMETEDSSVKSLSHWDPLHYLNIYVVHEITSVSQGSGVAGYAYFPSSHGMPEDGIVGEYTFMGSSPGFTSVFVHEAGHYLGLYHTFQGGCANSNCLVDGDRVCDTPPDQSTAGVPCASTVNTCTTDPDDVSANNPFRPVAQGGLGDVPDLSIAFMDYNAPNCMTVFTTGQSDRMRDALITTRYSLQQSLACNSPCATPVTASFNSSATNILLGATVNFTNTSTGGTFNSTWKINGVVNSTSTNFSYLFNSTGIFVVTLFIQSTLSVQCIDSMQTTITVTCPVQANFMASDTIVNPGDSVLFTSNAPGATTYSWLLNGTLMSTSQNFIQAFNNLGGYNIQLVVSNGSCSDTSQILFIQVGESGSGEAAYWYFGSNAGMKFTPTGPVVDLNNSLGMVQEGTACMSDANGQLLFYTNGITVKNKNHVTMPNGAGLFGGALSSATQATLILKKPGSTSLYYVFTVDEESGPNGLRYSIVDMTLNGGLGDVTQKNILMHTPAAEKLTATRHCNGVDYWVLAHGMANNTFYAYQLTPNGIGAVPVITNIGSVYNLFGYPQNEANSRGYLRLSVLGNKLVACILGKSKFELFDFDNITGVISNYTSSPTDLFLCYGAAFSPDDSKMYISAGVSSSATRYIYQYDMLAGSNTAIIATKQTAGSLPSFGAIALAPDGKIYAALSIPPNWSHIGVINNPNADAANCNFVQAGFFLQGKNSNAGLPNFMCNYFYAPTYSLTGPTGACINTPLTFTIHKPQNFPYSFNWHSSLGSNIQILNDSTAVITISQVGIDTIIINKINPCKYDADTIIVNATGPVVNLGNDTIICNSSSVTLAAQGVYTNYLWQNGSTVSQFTTNLPGTYWLEVTDINGCKARDTIVVTNTISPVLNLGNDTSLCGGGIVLLDAGSGFSNYTWQDNFNQQIYTAFTAGTFWVTVTDACGLIQTDSIHILQTASFNIDLGEDTTYCNSFSVTLGIAGNYQNYMWQNGSTNQSLIATNPGIYWLEVTDINGCKARDSVTLNSFIAPLLNLGNDTTLCSGATIIISAGLGYSQYTWQNNSSQSFYTVQNAGPVWVTVTDSCGSKQTDTIFITAVPLFDINLGNDTTVCDTANFSLHAGSDFTSYIWQDLQTDSIYLVNTSGIYSVVVADGNGCKASDSVSVTIKDCGITNPGQHFLVYPNPTAGEPVIDILQADVIGDVKITVVDMLGQLVYKEEVNTTSNSIQLELPLYKLEQAIYFLRVETSNQSRTVKLNIIY